MFQLFPAQHALQRSGAVRRSKAERPRGMLCHECFSPQPFWPHLHDIGAIQAVDAVGSKYATLQGGSSRVVAEPVAKVTKVGEDGL